MSEDQPLLFSPPLTLEETRKRTKISDEFFTVFSNHTRVAVSQTDLRMFFGETYPTAVGDTVITEVIGIVMTPQQAKAVLNLLAGTLAAYEKTFGEIKPPTGFPTQPMTAVQDAKEKSD